jgi:DNA-binding GntR family transcriptional regulator
MLPVSDPVRGAIAAEYGQQAEESPKYRRLKDAILRVIDLGILRTGDVLPPEQDLVATVPVSLGTVQKALGALTTEGKLVRRQGHGTFVASPPTTLVDPWHFRFFADDSEELLPVVARIVERKVVKQPGEWSTFLGHDAKGYVRITRLIEVNQEFACYNSFYLAASAYGGVMKLPLARLQGANLKQVLSELYGVTTHKVRQRIRSGRFPDAACSAMQVRRNTVGTIVEIQALSYRGLPMYYQSVLIPPSSRWLDVSALEEEQLRQLRGRGPAQA